MKIARWGLTASSALMFAAATAADQTATTTTTTTTTPASEGDSEPQEQQQIVIDQELLKQVQELTKQGLFVETFEDHEVLDESRWYKSTHEKYASQEVTLDEYTVRTGHLESDKGLVLDAPAKHYGLAAKLDQPLLIDGSEGKKELVIQYEVKLQKGLTCGGAYLKLLRKDLSVDFAGFSDDTPFVVMFGPDKCGSNDKVHFIFQHKNPTTGKYEEKHLDNPPQIKSDRLTHLYTLVIRDDNTYELFIDQKSASKGSLLENFTPTVLPDKEIDDPTDSKPSDWVDEPRIRDPSASKPDDWDEDAPARIPDDSAVKPEGWLDDEPASIIDPSVPKPEDWDDEDDGEWVAPQIANPKCEAGPGCGEWVRPTKANPVFKGKWQAPLIANPEYKGEWTPRKIPNPEYFEDEHPARMDPIGALAVEVWTMSDGITFDNFWLGNDFEKAVAFANLTFAPKQKLEVEVQEEQRARDRKDVEERRAKEGNVYNQIAGIATSFVEFAKQNPVVGVGTVLAVSVLSILIAFFVCCGKSDEIADEKEHDEPADDPIEKRETTDAKDTASSDGEKSNLRKRKSKAPVVQD